MDPLAWSICLLIAAIALIVLELFIPSGGLLSFLAAVAVVASVVVAFSAGPRTGFLMLIVVGVVVPAILASAVRWWPHTPIGQLILIALPDDPDDVLPDTEEYRGLRQLIGKVGKSKSKMLPSGAIVIEGRTYDAVSEGMAIDAGVTVKVMAVRTNRIVVRPTDQAVTSTIAPSTDEAADVLSQPIDSLGIDGFDEPLT
ncbi:MAG TPA: NfeD family protein [Pirellulaceae bacterium]|nr:NfeD family protein [Pirellulaceae bacterium]